MKSQENIDQKVNIPAHVAIIPDGNRRWAKGKGLPTLFGHKKGADNFDALIDKSMDLGIKCLTGWIFSTENWHRSKEEVDYLFDIARDLTKKYKKKCLEKQIRFVHLGRKDRLPKDLVDTILEMEEETKDYNKFTVAMGVDYGGHDELVRAIKELVKKGIEVSAEAITSVLDSGKLPNPDLIIRTSGEQRLSGFMSWQCAYAELYFTDVDFPDFGAKELEKAVLDYTNRERRFGGDSKK